MPSGTALGRLVRRQFGGVIDRIAHGWNRCTPATLAASAGKCIGRRRREGDRCVRPRRQVPRVGHGLRRFGGGHNVAMVDTAALRALISEYDRLRRLDDGGITEQVRGTLFNGFVADLLNAWGIDARASTATPAGEIDVMFNLDGQRYIAEAKWERSKTDLTPLSKLGTRLRQRMRGTNGVFISMAGYTTDALTALPEAGDRSILLLDRSHVEAMVSGLVAPDELVELALDHAAYRGEAYVPVLTLLASTEPMPAVTFDVASDDAGQPLAPGISARVTCAISAAGLVGVAPASPGKILVVGEEGIAEIDHANHVAAWRVPVKGCHGNPVLRPDGAIMFARGHGIGVVADGNLTVVAGGFPDRCSLFTKPDGSVWVLDPIDEARNLVTPTVVRLGEQLGKEQRHEIKPTPGWPVGAAWRDDTRLVLAHQSACSLVELDTAGPPDLVHLATSDCVGLVPLGTDSVMTVSGHADLALTDIVTGRNAKIGTLTGRPAVRGAARGDDTTTYIAVGARHGETAILAVELGMPAVDAVARVFTASDSGDLAGYRAEVVGLAARHAAPSGRSDTELQDMHNLMQQRVHDKLVGPVGDRVQALGLERTNEPKAGGLDGGWPPSYHGGTSCPTWRLPGREGAWLEASIGIGYRTWPSSRLDDLVLALMLAINTGQGQHTLLTRFIPLAPGDTELEGKIHGILADVDRVLPIAAALLADEGRDGNEPEHATRSDCAGTRA